MAIDDQNVAVSLVNLFGAQNLTPALKDGLVDGFVVMQPFVAMAEEQGAGRLVALLGDLSPDGQWKGIPCCAFAGNMESVTQYRPEVEAFLSLMMRASKYLVRNQDQAAGKVAGWLGVVEEVERRSLPTISFSNEFTDQWERGTNLWITTLIEKGSLKGRVKTAFEEGHVSDVIYDLDLYENARRNVD